VRLRPSPAGVIAVLALAVAATGTAEAATGGTFLLGRGNTATSTTSLSNTRGVALSLGGGSGQPALAVNNTVKVSRLNADLLDGLDSTLYQRRVGGSCQPSFSIRAITATGSVVCDDQQASVVEVRATGTGGASAFCPAGYVVTGGGFVPDPAASPQPFANVATLGTRSDPAPARDFYVASLSNPDGTPFTGSVVVTVRCIYGQVTDATGASGAALRRR
jgi:hypothetical protein